MELLEYLEKLELLENQSDWDEILKVSDEATENYPYSLSIRTYKVKALINKQKLISAKELCFDLIKSNPGSSVIHCLLASIYEKSGEIKKAIEEYNKILFLNPGDTEAAKEVERLNNILRGSPKSTVSESEEKEFDNSEEPFITDSKDIVTEEVKVEDKHKTILTSSQENIETENENQTYLKESSYEDSSVETQSDEQIINTKETGKTSGNIILNQTENTENNLEEPYVTYSMAKLLEKQNKFEEARQLYKKLFLLSSDKKAFIGYKRTGLKKFLGILENYLLRGKSNEHDS